MFTQEVFEKAEIDAIEAMRRAGHEIITLSPKELSRWQEKIRPQYDVWLADMQAKGLPGKKVLDEVLRLTEKYTKEDLRGGYVTLRA